MPPESGWGALRRAACQCLPPCTHATISRLPGGLLGSRIWGTGKGGAGLSPAGSIFGDGKTKSAMDACTGLQPKAFWAYGTMSWMGWENSKAGLASVFRLN